jgi:hypothetical protein
MAIKFVEAAVDYTQGCWYSSLIEEGSEWLGGKSSWYCSKNADCAEHILEIENNTDIMRDERTSSGLIRRVYICPTGWS